MTTSYTEFPSGRVLCCMRHDTGAIVCTSDATYGPFVVRAQEALQKAEQAYSRMYCDWSQPVGKIVDVVV